MEGAVDSPPTLDIVKLTKNNVHIQTARLILNLVTNVLIVLTVFTCILFSCTTSKRTIFQLHIIFSVLGYQFFMCQGILVLSKYNWSMLLKRRYRRHLHWILQVFAFIFILTGSAIMMKKKETNFNTAHGVLAVCALILCVLSCLNGTLVLNAHVLSSTVKVTLVRYTHFVTSIGSLFCATASLCFGFEKRSFKLWMDNDDAVHALMVLTWMFTLSVTMDFWINSTTRLCSLIIKSMMAIPNAPRLPGGTANTNNENSMFVLVMNITNTFTNLLLGAVAFNAILFANLFNIPGSLRQHIYLCVTGYIILMSQAVLSLNPYASWAKALKYEDKKVIHWIMQFIGSVLAISGSIVRMIDVPSNFQTAHGILGLVAMICTIFSLISGVVNLFSMTFRNNINLTKIAHSVLGTLALGTAYLALCFGFNNIYRVFYGDINANLSIALSVITLVSVLTTSSINTVKRILT